MPDVDGTPFWVEAKHRRRVSPRAAWEQAREATDGRPPVAVTRENRGPILVTLELSDFLEFVEGGGEGDSQS